MMAKAAVPIGGVEATAAALRAEGATALYVGVDGRLAGVIAIADPIKATTRAALDALRLNGIDENADGETKKLVDLPHPLGVTARQVVVDGDQVHTTAGEGIQVHGQSSNKRFTFTCLHLGDFTLVQDNATDELNIVVTHLDPAPTSFTHNGEGLRQEVIERLPVARALAQLIHAHAQLGIGVLFELRLERRDQSDPSLIQLELLRLADVQRAIKQ